MTETSTAASASRERSRLTLDVKEIVSEDSEYLAEGPIDPHPALELRILVDGEDVLPGIWDGVGRDPDDLVGIASPLLPRARPHTVPLLRCSCGEEGCGSLMACIRRDGDSVVWSDFRHTVGLDYGEGDRKRGEFRFDRDQYVTEVERAHRERQWEWPERTTARLVRELLGERRADLKAKGYELEWATAGAEDPVRYDPRSPDWGSWIPEGVTVSVLKGHRQLVLGFPGAIQNPDRRAREIVDWLLSTDPTEWPVTGRSYEFFNLGTERLIPAPRQAIRTVLIDFASRPERLLTSNYTDYVVEHQTNDTATIRYVLRRSALAAGHEFRMEVDAVEPPDERYIRPEVMESDVNSSARVDWSLEETSGGTLVTLHIAWERDDDRDLERLLPRRALQRIHDRVLERLADAVAETSERGK